jgi:hypothetical protein
VANGGEGSEELNVTANTANAAKTVTAAKLAINFPREVCILSSKVLFAKLTKSADLILALP